MESEPGRDQPRIGVIGCGTIGQTHLDAYRANGIAPTALADANPTALAAATGTYGGQGFSDPAHLLASGSIDAVSVCTPPASHPEIVTTALEAGIAILCEKPLATAVAAAEAMVATADRTGVLLAVGFCHRYQPQIERLRDLIQAGDLGTVLMFRNRFAGHLKGVEATWFAQPTIAGGGVIVDTCVHSVDLFRFLIGEPTRVQALTATTATPLGPALKVEDSAVITLRTADGVLGVIEASWRTPPGEWTLTLYGTGGTAVVDYATDQLRLLRAGAADWEKIETPDGDRFEREIAAFLTAIQGGDPPRATGADGLAATRILDAAYRSAAAGGESPANER